MSGPLSAEEITRSQVLSLFGRCNHDVGTLLDTIARGLHNAGRRDIQVHPDVNGNDIIVSQAPRHATKKGFATFVDSLEAITSQTMRDIERLKKRVVDENAAVKPAIKTRDELLQIAKQQVASATTHQDGHKKVERRRKLSKSRFVIVDEHSNIFPTSKYNGNYLLRRYGAGFQAKSTHCVLRSSVMMTGV